MKTPMSAVPRLSLRHRAVLLATALGLALGLAGTAVAAAPSVVAGGPYVDLVDYPGEYDQWDAYQDLRRRMRANFDDICGDTYCEGEFSDIQSLRLRCAVAQTTGTVSSCRWAFAASELGVDPASGQVQGRQPTWLCPLPVPPGTTVGAFFAALAGPRPLFQQLPGATASFHEALAECLH